MQQAALNFDPPPLERQPFVLAAAKRQGDAAIGGALQRFGPPQPGGGRIR